MQALQCSSVARLVFFSCLEKVNAVFELCFEALFIVLCNECSQTEFCLNVCRDLYWSQSHWAAIVGRAKGQRT